MNVVGSWLSDVVLTGLSILLPLCNSSSCSYPLTVLYRRKPSSCNPGLICTGSVRDNQFYTNGSYALNGTASSAAPGSPAGNMNDSSWQPLLTNVTVTGNGTVVDVNSPFSLTIAPGEVVGLWL